MAGSELWIQGSHRQLGSTGVHWGFWLFWHSGVSVVWEQLSLSAPAENPWYWTSWLLNCLHVCFIWISVSVCICVETCTWASLCSPNCCSLPFLSLALFFVNLVPLCVHLSILLLPSVCYLQPSCHISPLPATFLVISEEVTYLCLERRLLACDLWKQWDNDQSKENCGSIKQEIGMFTCLFTSTLAAFFIR